MGLGGISIWQLLIVLIIVVLLFGTKKLRSLGGDLGSSLRSFKSALKEGENELNEDPEKLSQSSSNNTTSDQKDKDSQPH